MSSKHPHLRLVSSLPSIPTKATRLTWDVIHRNFEKLGRYGICGMSWQNNQGRQEKASADFLTSMAAIPVATNEAAKILWQNESLQQELAELISKYDQLSPQEYKAKLEETLEKSGLTAIRSFPGQYFGLDKINSTSINFQDAHDEFISSTKLQRFYYETFGLDHQQVSNILFIKILHLIITEEIDSASIKHVEITKGSLYVQEKDDYGWLKLKVGRDI